MDFETAGGKIKNLFKKPTDNEMLQLYGLYKQATIGNVNTVGMEYCCQSKMGFMESLRKYFKK